MQTPADLRGRFRWMGVALVVGEAAGLTATGSPLWPSLATLLASALGMLGLGAWAARRAANASAEPTPAAIPGLPLALVLGVASGVGLGAAIGGFAHDLVFQATQHASVRIMQGALAVAFTIDGIVYLRMPRTFPRAELNRFVGWLFLAGAGLNALLLIMGFFW